MDVITLDKNLFANKADTIYQKIKNKLEQEYRGKIVAIDVDSGNYFIGSTVEEAGEKAKAKYPDKVFYFKRVGYPAVYIHR